MKGRNSSAVAIFIGALLIVIFVVGMIVDRNPAALTQKYRYNLALEQFGAFCAGVWLPAGIIGTATGTNDRTYGSEVRDDTAFVVTSGISGWAIPFKTGCRSEIVVIRVRGEG